MPPAAQGRATQGRGPHSAAHPAGVEGGAVLVPRAPGARAGPLCQTCGESARHPTPPRTCTNLLRVCSAASGPLRTGTAATGSGTVGLARLPGLRLRNSRQLPPPATCPSTRALPPPARSRPRGAGPSVPGGVPDPWGWLTRASANGDEQSALISGTWVSPCARPCPFGMRLCRFVETKAAADSDYPPGAGVALPGWNPNPGRPPQGPCHLPAGLGGQGLRCGWVTQSEAKTWSPGSRRAGGPSTASSHPGSPPLSQAPSTPGTQHLPAGRVACARSPPARGHRAGGRGVHRGAARPAPRLTFPSLNTVINRSHWAELGPSMTD